MSVSYITDASLLIKVIQHPFVVLNYHSDEGGQACLDFKPVFSKLSEDPKYKAIEFLTIDVENNPIAKKYIVDKKCSIVTCYYKAGF